MALGKRVGVPGIKGLYRNDVTGIYSVRNPKATPGVARPYIKLDATNEMEAIEQMGPALKLRRTIRPGQKLETTMREHWTALLAYQDGKLVTKKEKWGPATREERLRHWTMWIEPVMGDVKVREVEDLDCLAAMDALRETGKTVIDKVTGEERWEEYSTSVERQLYFTMSSIFRFARQARFGKLISESPLADIEAPELGGSKVLTREDILEQEDITALLRVAPEREGQLFLLADLTGARASELLGLQLRHHDPKAGLSGTLEFESQLRRRKQIDADNAPLLIPLKGKKDIAGSEARVLKLSPAANRLLIQLRLAAAGTPDAFFFATRSGLPLSQRNVGRTLAIAKAAAGIEKPCSMHSFRHHYASRMFAAGATIEEVQADLGHSSAAVTRKHYVRLINTDKLDARAAELHAAAGMI